MAEPIVINWAGGEHPFRLRIGELRALDDRCAEGAYQAMLRIRSMRFRVDDITETLRLGLIGGGMDGREAAHLVARMEEQHGIGVLTPIATAVLFHGFHRREEIDQPGEPEAAETPPP